MRKELENLAIDTIAATTIAAGGTALWNDAGWLPFNVGLITAGTIAIAGRHLWRPARSSYSNHNRRMVQMAAIQKMPRFDPDIARYKMTWKELPEPEFIFTGDILPLPVQRSELYRFLDIACQRQIRALNPTRGSRKRVKINWVLSERYYTKSARPRFPGELYWSIKLILNTTRLVRGQKQGASGHLIGGYGPMGYTDLAQQRWVAMFGSPAPRRRGLSIFGRFAN